jgi:hypothetical protein
MKAIEVEPKLTTEILQRMDKIFGIEKKEEDD